MDKSVELKKDIEEKPIDELGDLDDQLEDLILTANRSAEKTQRFALVVDATSSMHGVWNMAKTALKTAVDEIKLKSTVPIQVQVVAYRDHTDDAPSHVVECSEWSDDTNYLKTYIDEMRCHGGGDYPESIGHGLAHLQKSQVKVNQIILIGDAPSKPGSYGYYEAQLFGAQECPIYALHTDDEPQLVECFKKLAKLSGGKAFGLKRLEDLDDVFKVILASNKVLAITYQPTSIEGKKLALEMSK